MEQPDQLGLEYRYRSYILRFERSEQDYCSTSPNAWRIRISCLQTGKSKIFSDIPQLCDFLSSDVQEISQNRSQESD